MFSALDGLMRRNRRRLAILAFILFLAGAVLAAHSAIADDHMGDPVAMCLAVLETAALGLLSALILSERNPRARPPAVRVAVPNPALQRTPGPQLARAGPQRLQVLRR